LNLAGKHAGKERNTHTTQCRPILTFTPFAASLPSLLHLFLVVILSIFCEGSCTFISPVGISGKVA